MAGDQVRIKDLQRTTYADDSSVIAIDNDDETYGITVGDYNRNANATAYRHAQAAAASADAAAASASAAATTQSEVSTQVIAAQTAANNASTYAGQARSYSETAATAVVNASAYATAAAGSANSASSYADAASTQASAAQAWAIGETNSAKYWASVAEGAAGGGVTAFNGRSGTVTPQYGDYTAAQVPYTSSVTVADKLDSLDSGKMNAMTVDSSPTLNSDNLVTSGGVAQAIADIDIGDVLNTVVKYTDISSSTTQTTTGKKAADAVQLNPQVSGTLAAQIASNDSDITMLSNGKLDKSSVVNSSTTTESGYALDARQANESVSGTFANTVMNALKSRLNNSFAGTILNFGIDSNGNYGYIKAGADSVTPFRNPTGDAVAGDVVSGKTFSNASGDDITGNMATLTASNFTGSFSSNTAGQASNYQVKSSAAGYVPSGLQVHSKAAVTSPTIATTAATGTKTIDVEPGVYNKISVNQTPAYNAGKSAAKPSIGYSTQTVASASTTTLTITNGVIVGSVDSSRMLIILTKIGASVSQKYNYGNNFSYSGAAAGSIKITAPSTSQTIRLFTLPVTIS